MKVFTAVLAALLLMAICSSAGSPPGHSEMTACCFSYTERRIPLSFITAAYETSRMCSQPAVILVTRKGRQFCVKPQEPWVQEYMEHFQNLQN